MIVKHEISKSAWNVDYAVDLSQKAGAIVIDVDNNSFPRVVYLFFSQQSQLERYKQLFNDKMDDIIMGHREKIGELEKIKYPSLPEIKQYINELTFSCDMYTRQIATFAYSMIKDVRTMHMLLIKISYIRLDLLAKGEDKNAVDDMVNDIIHCILKKGEQSNAEER